MDFTKGEEMRYFWHFVWFWCSVDQQRNNRQ